MCRPVADDAVEFKVCLGEVIADRNEWFLREFGGGVCHGVSVVEGGGVATLSVLEVGPMCDPRVLECEWLEFEVDFGPEAVEDGAGCGAVAAGEHDEAFGGVRRGHDRATVAGEGGRDLFGVGGFALDQGNKG